MTQEELANGLGKTRSLVSYFERTGNINTYTLQEITSILGANPEEVNLDDNWISPQEEADTQANGNSHPGVLQNLLDQQQAEILFLKETINFQWNLLNELSKSKSQTNLSGH